MKCPNCGKDVKEGSKFCVGCGTSLNQEVENTEVKENVETNNVESTQENVAETKKTEVKDAVNQKVKEVKEGMKKAANSNFMQVVLASLMFLFNILLKPMKCLKEKIEFYSNPKNGFILAGVLALVTMIVRILVTLLTNLFNRNCVTIWGEKVCNSAKIDWMGITLKHLLVILLVMFVVSGVYYIGSLIAKKSTNFFRLLGITIIAFVPYCVAEYLLAPIFGLLSGHIGSIVSTVGTVYSIVIFGWAIKDEFKFSSEDKNVFFHFMCLAIIMIVAYIIQLLLFQTAAADSASDILNSILSY